jgi:hypothetical protein
LAKKRRKKSLRSILLREVRDRLSKVFVEKGFSAAPLRPDELGTQLEQAFPLGRLRRRRGDELDIVELQFDAHGQPEFVINFGTAPKEGVTMSWGFHMDQESACVSGLPDGYRLYSSSFRKRWFKLGLFSSKDERAIRRLVDKAVLLSEEIDDWFESRTVGRHVKFAGYSKPLPLKNA